MLKIIPLVVLTATCFAGTGELEVRVRPTAAGPQIHVDGKPVPPRFFFYWAGSRSSETNAVTNVVWATYPVTLRAYRGHDLSNADRTFYVLYSVATRVKTFTSSTS